MKNYFAFVVLFLTGMIIGVAVKQLANDVSFASILAIIILVTAVMLALALINALWQKRRAASDVAELRVPSAENLTLRRWAIVELLLLGLVLAGGGQIIFSFVRDWIPVGVVAYASGLIVLVSLVRVAQGESTLNRVEASAVAWLNRVDDRRGAQVFLTLIAAVGMALCVSVSQSERAANDYWLGFYAWLGAILALVIAFIVLPTRGTWHACAAALKSVRLEIWLVVALTAFAFLVRVIDLTNIPYPLAGDEASIGLEGQRILAGDASNLFSSGWQSEPSMSFLPWALAMAVWGQSVLALRLLAALIGTLTIPALYWLARRMFDLPTALLSAALLAAMSVHIHFSRIAVNNVMNAFFACVVFGLIYQAVTTRRATWFAAAGIMSGLTLYTFVGSRLVAILAGAFLLYAGVTDQNVRRAWRKLALFALTAGLVMLPLALFFLQHTDIAFGRLTDVSAFSSGWIDREMQATGHSLWFILANQIAWSVLVLVSTPAIQGFYNSPGPLFDPLWSLALILGLGFSVLRLREIKHAILQIWFWSVLLFAGVLITPPPFAERYVMLYPVVAIFAGYGIVNVVSLLTTAFNRRGLATALLVVSGLALAITSLNFYFRDYTPQHYYTDANSEVGAELGQALARAPRDVRVYFLGEPRMFYEFPSLTFLSRQLEGVDVRIGDDVRALVIPARLAIFVALPERQADLNQIRAQYPDGEYQQVFRRTQPDELLYAAYTVKP